MTKDEERNRVIAFLARVCRVHGGGNSSYGAGLAVDIQKVSGWQNVVFIDTPVGQLSWHIPDHDMHLFHDIPSYTGKWDGHSQEERDRRLDENL